MSTATRSHHTATDPISIVLERLPSHRKAGNGWCAKCPAHEDGNPSLSIAIGEDRRVLIKCQAGCSTEDIVAALGLTLSDLFPPRSTNGNGFNGHRNSYSQRVKPARSNKVVDAVYQYVDPKTGETLYEKVRYRPKGFQQRRPDGKGGFTYSLEGVKRVLYRLAELNEADHSGMVFLANGEKAVDALVKAGLVATCTCDGEGKWRDEYTQQLSQRNVAVLLDNDPTGIKHGETVSAALAPVVASLRLIALPGLPPKGDVCDFLESGRTVQEVVEICEATPVYRPADFLTGGPVVTCLADVRKESIRWMWSGRLAIGKAVLWVGAPGDGKGTVAADITARVSTGSPMPDGSPGMLGDVLLIASEDGLSDMLAPRCEVAGADLRRVHHVAMIRRQDENGKQHECLLTLDNVSAIEKVLDGIRARGGDTTLLIVDPVGNHIGERTDTDKDNRVRAVLTPLCSMAERYNLALVLIVHRRKASGGSADETAMGSRAYTGLARAVFHFGRDKKNRDVRYFLAGKSNIGKEAPGLSFRIEDCNGIGRAVWDKSPVEMSADDLLSASDGHTGPEPERREAGEDFLRQLLADGPVASAEVQKQAKAQGIAWRTIRRAADALEVRREKSAFNRGWQWRLPKLVTSELGQVGPCVGNMDNMDTFGFPHQGGHIKSQLARGDAEDGQDTRTVDNRDGRERGEL